MNNIDKAYKALSTSENFTGSLRSDFLEAALKAIANELALELDDMGWNKLQINGGLAEAVKQAITKA